MVPTKDLELALLDIDDILGRALCPYFLLKDTAKAICDSKSLSGDGIYIGVLKKNITPEVLSVLKMYVKDDITDKINGSGFSYQFNAVPVKVQFISEDYPFFKHPDSEFYLASEYNIPNPFKDYLALTNFI